MKFTGLKKTNGEKCSIFDVQPKFKQFFKKNGRTEAFGVWKLSVKYPKPIVIAKKKNLKNYETREFY